jgi:hypothetical protein
MSTLSAGIAMGNGQSEIEWPFPEAEAVAYFRDAAWGVWILIYFSTLAVGGPLCIGYGLVRYRGTSLFIPYVITCIAAVLAIASRYDRMVTLGPPEAPNYVLAVLLHLLSYSAIAVFLVIARDAEVWRRIRPFRIAQVWFLIQVLSNIVWLTNRAFIKGPILFIALMVVRWVLQRVHGNAE